MSFKYYLPMQKIDRAAREVYGYASTEAEDSQGEIVRRAALEAALPAYMRFANIREMHQPSAVGVAKEAAVDETGLFLKARIVDDEAWRKVTEGVYKGFSIGGAVTARDPADPRVITGVELTEISLVDRPANPEAVFAVWKSSDGKERSEMGLSAEALKAARARLAQKWVASDGRAFARAEDAAKHEAGLAQDGAPPPASEAQPASAGPAPAARKPLGKGAGALARLAAAVQEMAALVDALAEEEGAMPDSLARAAAPAELAKLAARTEALEDGLGTVLPLLKEMRDLVEKVAAQPAVVPPARLVAVDKGADVARELERIAQQPPAVTAFELIRRAMREPIPFGAPLGK
ncbi:MAG TPA: HK97 family phage prohead protease [Stellaceae bacterium]|nr:HK97 family phage prohead protease [Stellaceae bacterium]